MGASERDIDLLYVEDDEVDIQSMLRIFKKVNELIQIDIARNGLEALNKLNGENGETRLKPKIILLDINMPGMSGLEFLKKLRSNSEFSDIDVFIITGAFSSKDKLAMHDLNVKGHIIKPLEYSDALNIFWGLQD